MGSEMFDDLLFAVTLLSAIGSGLMAGLFFAFSAFVMTALARLPGSQGIAAMQSINVAILNPVFFVVFFGTPLGCILLVVVAFVGWAEPGAILLLAGGLLYLVISSACFS